MSDDLIKQLHHYANGECDMTPVGSTLLEAADRIEQLNERLTAATDDASEAEAYAEQLEAKLTKAVETLREFAKQKRTTEMDVDEYDQADIEGAYCQFIFKARTTLAELGELEGKE
jgi:hypothetical protein